MKKHLSSNLAWGLASLVVILLIVFLLPSAFEKKYSAASPSLATTTSATATSAPAYIVTHISTPASVKAIYMTACVAATPSWRESLKNFIESTELNAIVIDIKDYSGTVSIPDQSLEADGVSALPAGGQGCKAKDMIEFLGELHKAGIYAIGRITVFQDPYYAKLHPELAVKSLSTGGVWRDKKGLAFIDVGAKPYWDYIVKLSKASYSIGFDELNFDYIRYPSDGDMEDAEYSWTVGTSTKAEMLESFFSYLHGSLAGTRVVTSADLFGQTTLDYDDMGIGQVLERALPYFDFIDPMVYPSHYAWNAGGFGDPALHPYEIVHLSMSTARERELAYLTSNGLATSTPSKLRPWLQDFDLGANYGAPEVEAQKRATYDSGLVSWLVWDAGNRYTREAYVPNTPNLTQQ